MIQKIYKILKSKTRYWHTRHMEDALDIINSDFTTLVQECIAGNIDKVKSLLNSRTDVEENAYGLDALMCASYGGNLDLVKLLLKHPSTDKNKEDCFWNNALSYACKKGMDIFKFLLTNGVGNIKQTDSMGITLCMFACYFGHMDIVEFLLKQEEFDINCEDSDGNTALMYACLGGNYEIVQLLLNHSEENDLIDPNKENETLLMFACEGGNFELVKLFSEKFTFEPSNNHTTPLMYAAKGGNPDVIRFIFDKKPEDLNGQDKGGMTALMHACERQNLEAVKVLLGQQDIDVNIVCGDNDSDESALMISCREDIPFEIADMLVKHPDIDISKTGKSKHTPLMVACGSGRFDIAKLLLTNPEIRNVNKPDKTGTTAFMYACEGGNVDLVKYFLEDKIYKNKTFNANKVNKQGCTALTNACGYHNLDVVELLLRRNDMDVGLGNPLLACCCGNSDNKKATKIAGLLLKHPKRNFDINEGHIYHGTTSLMFACKYDNFELVKLLLEQPDVSINQLEDSYDISALMYACESKNTKLVELFLQRDDLNITQIDVYGRNALVFAHTKEIMQLLLATAKFSRDDIYNMGCAWDFIHFANDDAAIWFIETYRDFLDVNTSSYYSPLIWACVERKQKLVEYLLKREDIDVNFATKNGDTALFEAFLENMQAAKLLLNRKDLNLSHVNNEKQNALMLACKNCSLDAVELILNRMVIDINARDKYGNTALMYACEGWNANIVALLLKQKNVSVDTRNEKGQTALMLAAKNGNVSVIKTLLRCNGGDTELKDKDGKAVEAYICHGRQSLIDNA